MCPERPQYVPSNVAAFRLSSAGPHGPDGDQGSIVFSKRKDRETWVKNNVFYWLGAAFTHISQFNMTKYYCFLILLCCSVGRWQKMCSFCHLHPLLQPHLPAPPGTSIMIYCQKCRSSSASGYTPLDSFYQQSCHPIFPKDTQRDAIKKHVGWMAKHS